MGGIPPNNMNPSDMTIYSFPFAAGSQYSYNDFVKISPEWLAWKPLEYAGRGKRVFEKPKTDIHEIVDEFMEYFSKNLKNPFAFFGHSMGSLIAYLLTVEFEKNNMPMPEHLFLSGRGGACIPERFRKAEHMTQKEIIAEILEMDGKIQNLLQNPTLLNAYERVLRADVMALEKYDYQLGTKQPLTIKATVFIGDNDIYTPAQAQIWQKEFEQPIDLHIMHGGHFFLFDHYQPMMKIIENTLEKKRIGALY